MTCPRASDPTHVCSNRFGHTPRSPHWRCTTGERVDIPALIEDLNKALEAARVEEGVCAWCGAASPTGRAVSVAGEPAGRLCQACTAEASHVEDRAERLA